MIDNEEEMAELLRRALEQNEEAAIAIGAHIQTFGCDQKYWDRAAGGVGSESAKEHTLRVATSLLNLIYPDGPPDPGHGRDI